MNLKALAKQLKTKELKVKKVIFELENEKWIFEDPKVVEANVMGARLFQVFGEFKTEENISEEDLEIIMSKTNCSRETALKALKKTRDLAEAILLIENKKI